MDQIHASWNVLDVALFFLWVFLTNYSDTLPDRAQERDGISYTNHCEELFIRILCSIGHKIGMGFHCEVFIRILCSIGHRIYKPFFSHTVHDRAQDWYGYSNTNYCEVFIRIMCSIEHMNCMNWVSDLYGFCYTNQCYELFIRILCPFGHRICMRWV